MPPLRGGALRCSPHRLARRNSLRSLRELRSDNRRESDERCALRAPPVRLRFSAAHKARPRRTARAFADAVAVLARKALVFDPHTTDAARAAPGGVRLCAPCAASALGWPGRAASARAP
ncbi:MAG: hypothetical protein KJZ98_16120, partial [Burkholderiaceae bacterium]|nr:hypothetical protein [Burkholderiaceae bacterium]